MTSENEDFDNWNMANDVMGKRERFPTENNDIDDMNAVRSAGIPLTTPGLPWNRNNNNSFATEFSPGPRVGELCMTIPSNRSIQEEENKELKKEIQKLRRAVGMLKSVKGCDCNHKTHWSSDYKGDCEKRDGICIVTFSMRDGVFAQPNTRGKFLCCSQCIDHFYYNGMDGSDPARGMEMDFLD